MATTTFLAYVKPRRTFAISEARSANFTAYVPIRSVSGLYADGVQPVNTTNKKNWQPSSNQRIGTVTMGDKSYDVMLDPSWKRFFSYIGGTKLGGPTFPTLPDVTQFLTVNQAQALFTQQINSALAQQTAAIAQSVASLLEVVKNTAAAGAAQVPPPPLAPAETNAPTISTKPFLDNGSTGGGGGGD